MNLHNSHIIVSWKVNGESLKGIQEQDADKLLEFFQADASSYDFQEIALLKSLPLYKTADDELVDLARPYARYKVVPRDVPLLELEVLARLTKTIFMKERPEFQTLYSRLFGSETLDAYQFFTQVVLPSFAQLSSQSRLSYLEYIKKILFPSLGYADSTKLNNLKSQLVKLEFIPLIARSNVLYPAKDFVDPEHPVLAAMRPEYVPPKPFDSDEWLRFLREVGLKQNVTEEEFLEFAEEIAQEAQDCAEDGVKRKSQILVRHLFQSRSLREVMFVNKLAEIKFIPVEKVGINLTLISSLT